MTHVVFAEWLEVREERDALANFFEVVDAEWDIGGVCDGEEVQDQVSRTAERQAGGDRILKGLTRHDVAWLEVELQEFEYGCTGIFAVFTLGFTDCYLSTAAGQAHTESFDRAGHGIGSIHAATRSGTRDRIFFDFFEFFIRQLTFGMLADCFKYRDDIHRITLFFIVRHQAGENGAAVNKHSWAVEAGECDHATGHVLITATDSDQTVKTFCRDHCFDRVGNHIARDEAVAHPFGAHTNAVGNGDGTEVHRFAAGIIDTDGGVCGEVAQMHVAGSQITRRAGHADLWLFEIGIFEADCTKHRAGRGAVIAIDDD